VKGTPVEVDSLTLVMIFGNSVESEKIGFLFRQ